MSSLLDSYSYLISDSWKEKYVSQNLEGKMEMIQKLKDSLEEKYNYLLKEIEQLKNERTIKIILKNNFINEKAILMKSIKDIKKQSDLKENKIKDKLEELEKQSNLELNIIDKENKKKIEIIKENNKKIIQDKILERNIDIENYKNLIYNINIKEKKNNKYNELFEKYKKSKDNLIKQKEFSISKQRYNIRKNRLSSLKKYNEINENYSLIVKAKKKKLENSKSKYIKLIKSSKSINNLQLFKFDL